MVVCIGLVWFGLDNYAWAGMVLGWIKWGRYGRIGMIYVGFVLAWYG